MIKITSEQGVRDALKLADGIIDTVKTPLLVLDQNMKVIRASRSFLQTFHVSIEQTRNKLVYELGNGQWNIPQLRLLLEVLLPNRGGEFHNFEVRHSFDAIGEKSMRLSGRGIYRKGKKPVMILLTIEDQTDLKKAEEQSRLIVAELLRMDKVKSQHIADVSHETKNPLMIIREALALVLDGIYGKLGAQQKNILGVALHSIDRLTRLVSDLLNLSAIESGKRTLTRDRLLIGPFVSELMNTYRAEIRKKRQTFQKVIAPKIGPLWADRDLLSEVVINLLNNAIKYTPRGGVIRIEVKSAGGNIRFEISDNGPGIPAESLGRIFDRYERIGAEKAEGTGLGLPIAAEIVGLHGGKIWAESHPGEGSRFIFVLPRRQPKGTKAKTKRAKRGQSLGTGPGDRS